MLDYIILMRCKEIMTNKDSGTKKKMLHIRVPDNLLEVMMEDAAEHGNSLTSIARQRLVEYYKLLEEWGTRTPQPR